MIQKEAGRRRRDRSRPVAKTTDMYSPMVEAEKSSTHSRSGPRYSASRAMLKHRREPSRRPRDPTSRRNQAIDEGSGRRLEGFGRTSSHAPDENLTREMISEVPDAQLPGIQCHRRVNEVGNTMGNCVGGIGRYIGEEFVGVLRDRPEYCGAIMNFKEDRDKYGERENDGARGNIPIGLLGYLSIRGLRLDGGGANTERRQRLE